MQCKNCGTMLHEYETICPNCQTVVHVEVVSEHANTKYEEYKEQEKLMEKYKTKNLLIWSIVELICCNQIFGIIAILLLELKMKKAIKEGRFNDAENDKKLVITMLILGVVISVGLNILSVALELIPLLAEV